MTRIYIHLPGDDGTIVCDPDRALNPTRFENLSEQPGGYVFKNESMDLSVIRWVPSNVAPYKRIRALDKGNLICCDFMDSSVNVDLYDWFDKYTTNRGFFYFYLLPLPPKRSLDLQCCNCAHLARMRGVNSTIRFG
jgi:hypothetical protein